MHRLLKTRNAQLKSEVVAKLISGKYFLFHFHIHTSEISILFLLPLRITPVQVVAKSRLHHLRPIPAAFPAETALVDGSRGRGEIPRETRPTHSDQGRSGRTLRYRPSGQQSTRAPVSGVQRQATRIRREHVSTGHMIIERLTKCSRTRYSSLDRTLP